jgi:hypothetical protein
MFALKRQSQSDEGRQSLTILDGGGRSSAFSLDSVLKCIRAQLTVLNISAFIFAIYFSQLFWKSISKYWFHPGWTTDDALQQIAPFHSVFNPHIFKGDLILDVMVGYLAPLHYWVCYITTWLCGDPVMMGHWVMLLQIVLAGTFIFLGVKHAAGTTPAIIAVVWLLHSRQIIQRMTAGLPRGWAAIVLSAFLYFALTKNHKGVLAALFAGCLLHPPSTLIAAAAYGLHLLWGVSRRSTRREFFKPLIILVILSPIYVCTTWYVVKRPPSVGQMVTYEQAAAMPEFQYPHGRFPFVPLRPASEEVRTYVFQSFIARFFNPDRVWKGSWLHQVSGDQRFFKHNMRYIVVALFGGLLLVGLIRKRVVLPSQLVCLLVAIAGVYLASRALAFKLYVPNRHLQFPMGIFFLMGTPIVVWRAFHSGIRGDEGEAGYRNTSLKRAWMSGLAMVALVAFVYVGSGTGLYGTANFNYSSTKKGNVFLWIKKHTPEDALIAGHPTFIDSVMLFGMRRGFATTETAHPFYQGYYYTIKRRLEVSLRAHFAHDSEELLALVEPEGIDYFVFEQKAFHSDALKAADYHPPLDTLVKELASDDPASYLFAKLPRRVDLQTAPYMPFRDRYSAVIDVAKLREFVSVQKASVE